MDAVIDAPPPANGVCNDPALTKLPFCDPTRSIDVRVDDLVARLHDEELIGLLVNNASAVERLKLPEYGWWSEGLHGVALSPAVRFRPPTPYATSFPQVISVAASFNATLFHRIGDAISTEARAFYSAGNAGLTYWAPNINIFRDPRWGRGQETPGEDPLLTATYATAFVRGMQGEPLVHEDSESSQRFLKTSACCKHFSAYSQEIPRHRNNAMVTKQDQTDTYLPAFEACITRGHASGVMCSYNAVNGVPSCADKHLLTGLLREQWQFDGYITSDCEAVRDILEQHHFTQTPERTCATVLRAGMDLNCGDFLSAFLPSAMRAKTVERADLERAVKRLFRVQMRLGLFEKGKQPHADITAKDVDTPRHKQLAFEAALQSIVLLKNDDSLLPLKLETFKDSTKSSLGLLGPHVNASAVLLGNYQGIPSSISTPLEAIRAHYVDHVEVEVGCNVSDIQPPDLSPAEALARRADQLVVFVGLDQTQEREEIDRDHLELPGYQPELLERVLTAARRPIVLVVITGGAVNLALYKTHRKVGAIVLGGYLGQSGGLALAHVLFGSYNPSGRLTQTFYDGSLVEACSIYDMHMRPYPPTGNPGRTYRFYTGQPVFPFGHGLSFTTFQVVWQDGAREDSIASQEDAENRDGLLLDTTIVVRNVGATAGEMVVLVHAVPPLAGRRQRPLKTLVHFARTPVLRPQESTSVRLKLGKKAFSLADGNGEWHVVPGTWQVVVEDQEREIIIASTKAKEQHAAAVERTRA
ncbi:TPA: hypothetical protein N0F65_007755 [Lagenidium giganteum]|uniref:Fibronectin type III-like domain-containing protein n=1 Tax=Lagenidium giganteum TaxID=4803 RepID=A0AAV2Z016_9STRA|nr:TPA: hypothetical protein N0F65_007755 [Lagenidium giganteum]